MNTTSSRARALARALLAGTALCGLAAGPAAAQPSAYELPEKLVDSNGVDLPGGHLIITFPVIHFGDQVRMKADYYAHYPEAQVSVPSAKWAFNFVYRPAIGGSDGDMPTFWTPLGPAAYHILSAWETVMPDGRAFSKPAGGTFLTQFWSASWQTPGRTDAGMYDREGNKWEPGPQTSTTMTSYARFVDGEVWTIRSQKSAFAFGVRVRSVVSNRGWIIQYEYQREPMPNVQSELNSWMIPVKISGGSLAHHYCDTSGVALCPAIASAGNAVTIGHFANGYEVTHDSGFKRRLEAPTPAQLRISTPGTNAQMTASMTGTLCEQMGSVLHQVTRNGQTWTYNFEQCTEEERGLSWILARTDPLGKTIRIRQSSSYSIPESYVDELGRESSFGGSPTVGYAGYSHPEGNSVGKTFDSRNNRTSSYVLGKSGGLLQTQAKFDPVCANLVTCNRPNKTIDAKGNETIYTYDPVHGGVLTKTGPAVNGISPQTRYEYAQKYAWLKNASGGYSPTATPFWVLVRERFCRTTQGSASGCAGGAADEVVTNYDYGPNSGPNNLLLRGTAVTADGQTRRTCFGYDQMGRKISETTPRAGLASCS